MSASSCVRPSIGRTLIQTGGNYPWQVTGIGRSLGITTTVEGVETQTQLAAVNAEGFDEAQGYLFARPLSAEQVFEVIQAGQIE
ncbi:EAL domain-containing protein [Sinorhizobium meliloti]|nr:EAL domain-containing protein [Sinorhizobium meliloti]